MNTLNRTLKSLLATACVPFFVVACCSGVEDPDTALQVEVEEAPAQSTDERGPTVCGASVIARADDGEEVVLEESTAVDSDGNSRCIYRGQVDPTKLYTVEVKREDKIAVLPTAESNPACSVATPTEDTDGFAVLRDPALATDEAALQYTMATRRQEGLTVRR